MFEAALALGLFANLLSSWIIRTDIRRRFPADWRYGYSPHRWLAVMGLLLGAAALQVPIMKLLPLALFLVAVACDFETSVLPQPSFMAAAWLTCIAAGYGLAGVGGLKNVVLAQAIAYVFTTLAAFLRLVDAGDVWLFALWGAVIGSPVLAGMGFVALTVVWAPAVFLMRESARRHGAQASAITLSRAPVGPAALLALLATVVIAKWVWL